MLRWLHISLGIKRKNAVKSDSEKYNERVKPNTEFLNELQQKLPNFFNGEGEFDLEKFKTQLADNNINELKDGYQLNFIGKNYARRQAGEIPDSVIVPDNKQNVEEGKNSKNIFFTGDNIEVLRHLQNNYANKIDVIYIDPPYNTENKDFVYPDKFEYSDEKLMEMFGIDDSQIERLKSIQGTSSHSAWLSFMFPRLVLAKNLLADDGLFFISIDHNEHDNLKLICNEIFGEVNFQTDFIWKSTAGSNTGSDLKNVTEYVICYSKNRNLSRIGTEKVTDQTKYKLSDQHVKNRGRYLLNKLDRRMTMQHYSESLNYPIEMEDGTSVFPGGEEVKQNNWNWRWSRSKLQWGIENDFIVFKEINGKWSVYFKQYFGVDNNNNKVERSVPYQNLLLANRMNSSSGTAEVTKLFDEKKVFDYPKPVTLIKYLINIMDKKDAVVLDFFAGSATTAEATMRLNAEDGGKRKFILIQLAEKTFTMKDGKEVPTNGGAVAYSAGFKSIDEISRERIRRSASQIRKENNLTLPDGFDDSFKHYRVIEPNKETLEKIEDFNINNTTLFTDMVESFSSEELNTAGAATGVETILTTWLAKDGYMFDTSVKKILFDNYVAYLVGDNRLYIIDDGWTSENTKELLNKIGTRQLSLQSIVLFGYSFNIAELRELEIGLRQLDVNINLLKRY